MPLAVYLFATSSGSATAFTGDAPALSLASGDRPRDRPRPGCRAQAPAYGSGKAAQRPVPAQTPRTLPRPSLAARDLHESHMGIHHGLHA